MDLFIPKSIAALKGLKVTMVACGDTHTLAVTQQGAIYSFGRNQVGPAFLPAMASSVSGSVPPPAASMDADMPPHAPLSRMDSLGTAPPKTA